MLNHFNINKYNKIQENKQKRFSKFYKNNKKIKKTFDINVIHDSYNLTYVQPKNKTLLFYDIQTIHFDDNLKHKQHIVMNINMTIPILTDIDTNNHTRNHDNKIQTLQSIFDFTGFNHMNMKPIFLNTTYSNTDKPTSIKSTVKTQFNIFGLIQKNKINQISMNINTSKTVTEPTNLYDFLHNYSPITMNMNMDTNLTEHEPIHNIYDFQHNYSHINMNMDTNLTEHEPIHNFKTFKNDFKKLDGNIQHFDGNIDMSLITKNNYNFNLFNYKPIHKQNTIDNHFVNNTDFISIIPLKIFQTWHTLDLPPKMKQNVELLQKQNPEFTHYLYDDKMCRDFIQEHFDEDVLWAFDKLKPGAYKADLWRYCVLYIHGGIYLDIKYKCINNFKLIQLTDQEYWVKDRKYSIFSNSNNKNMGIYQAFIISLPNNILFQNSINLIIQNCKYNYYQNNDLAITGPHLISTFYSQTQIYNFILNFNGHQILYNRKPILQYYDEYRNEQLRNSNTGYYKVLWLRRNAFNYPTLIPQNTTNFTNTIKTNNITMYSGTPTIIQHPNNNNLYIVNLRWINYNYNENGSKDSIPQQWVSLNTRFTVDNHFEQITDTYFLIENIDEEYNFPSTGIEDIRIFKFKNKLYYLATRYNPILKRPYVCSNEYNIDNTDYKLNKTYINPIFYNVNKTIKAEKNWAMFEYKTKLSVVYDWYPLQIGCINYDSYELDIIETKTDIPEFFKKTRGSTPGCLFNNEIWFVLHKSQNNTKYIKEHYEIIYNKHVTQMTAIFNYQHFFAVFDLNMNLKRHSELFKLGDKMVEFCTGLIMEEDRLILSYSLLDTNSYVSTYDYDTIRNSIKWYKH